MKQPVDPAKCTATYLWTGLRTPGIFIVTVEGEAPNFTTGTTIQRDSHYVGGLKLDSMGWTGPRAEGTTPYVSKGSFNGAFVPAIVISGSNGDFIIDVKEVPSENVDDYVQKQSA